MLTKEIFLKRFISISIIFSLYLVHVINDFFLDQSLYGDKIFNIPNNLWYIIFILILFTFFLYLFTKAYEDLIASGEKYFKLSGFWMIFILSFFYKYLVFKFQLYGNYTENIEEVYLGNEFGAYQLYNYLAFILYKISPNHNVYLFLINNILGSLSVSFFYLILKKINNMSLLNHMVITFTVMYMPLIALETILRMDIMYIFLFILSFYQIILLVKNPSNTNIIFFLLIMFFLSLSREQTLYFLPLYLFYILINNFEKKYIVSIFMILVVAVTSFVISDLNKKKYGITSQYRDLHLIVKISQYGYLNDVLSQNIEKKLNQDAKILFSDIKNAYDINIMPHKREASKNLSSPYYYLLRPDSESIRKKSQPSAADAQYEAFNNVQKLIINKISKISKDYGLIDLKKFDNEISSLIKTLEDKNEKAMMIFIKSYVINNYLTQNNKTLGHVLMCRVDDSDKYDTDCILSIFQSINNKNFFMARQDNWNYTKLALQFARQQNLDAPGYQQHPKIDMLPEIILAMPSLYITQSVLTLTSMTGRVPVQTGLGAASKFYENNIIPNVFLASPFQKFYSMPINYWYIFSFWSLFISIFFVKKVQKRNINLLVSLIPLYYGFFISFATYAEFMRLMIPVVPFIIYNFMFTIKYIQESFSRE